MNLMKALGPSTILTLIVAAMSGATSSQMHLLRLESATLGGYSFFWSWPFFLTVMALNGILAMKADNGLNA